MNTRFMLPASIAAAAHLAVLFGYRCPPGPKPPVAPRDPPTTVIWTTPDTPDEPISSDEPAAGPRGVTTLRPPTNDEPPPRPAPGIVVEPRVPDDSGTIVHSPTIIPGPFGDPDATGDDRSRRGPAIVDVKSLDHEPRTRSMLSPVYPSSAAADGRRGEVMVAFVVDEEGRVRNPRVVRSTDVVFEAPTLRAVERWRFAPGRRNGHVVRFRMAVPVVFSLGS